jgi:hypothetical protein
MNGMFDDDGPNGSFGYTDEETMSLGRRLPDALLRHLELKRMQAEGASITYMSPQAATISVAGYPPDVRISAGAAQSPAVHARTRDELRVTSFRHVIHPGARLARIAQLILTPKFRTRCLEPMIADMQYEHAEAANAGDSLLCTFVLVRGYFLIAVMLLSGIADAVKRLVHPWR